jgi:hypothetical protein
MDATLAAGLGLALASALALDLGFLLQQHAASRLPALHLSRPLASARSLGGARVWVAGFAIGLGGWALYLAALTRAPLSLVQTVAAAGIVILVALAAVASRRLPPRRERLGAGLAAIGLGALAASLPSHVASADRAGISLPLIALSALAAVAAAALARGSRAGAVGLAAGAFYGLGDVWSKLLLDGLPSHPGALDVLGRPALYATAAAHLAGFLALQRAFQRGGPIAAIVPMTALMNLLPMVAGPLVLGEALPADPRLAALRLVAFACASSGAALLVAERREPTPSEPGLRGSRHPVAAGSP